MLLPVEVAEAQLPTAPYQVIDLYPMSAGSVPLNDFTGPGFNGSHYNQLAAGGDFVANTSTFTFISISATANAYLWNGSSDPAAMNATATGFPYVYIAGTDGVQQVGDGIAKGGHLTDAQATLWSGTAASAIDLNPSQLGATSSYAFGVKNGQQVGYTVLSGRNTETATLWNGNAASAVLLTSPTLLEDAEAIATDGINQVGWVDSALTAHAALWTGSAASVVDLNPTGFSVSQAVTVAGGQEGGWAISSTGLGHAHPGIWAGSADSFVDLTPTALSQNHVNFDGSVMSTNGIQQVGYFAVGGGFVGSPIIWSGTANSAEFLPTFGNDIFTPYDIDDAGNIYGIAEDPSGNLIAVEWVPTPEPGSMALFACGAAGLLLRRRRRRE